MAATQDVQRLIERLTRVKNGMELGKDGETVEEAIEAIEFAYRVMMPFGKRLAMLLDASLPALEKEAVAERNREAGKAMRCITAQGRVEGVKEALVKAEAVFRWMS